MQIAMLSAAVLILTGCGAEPPQSAAAAAPPAPATTEAGPSSQSEVAAGLFPDGPAEADFPHLHGLLQVTDRIYSGGEPQDEQAFAELAALGVRTVVSVDGARPNVDAAERQGLRYVHIPLGYNGISRAAGKSLARLVREAEGPFYVHCHHGVHRGPAAAAIACMADGGVDGKAALEVLERAGTSKGYAGLWRDVEAYTPPTADEELPELVAVAEVGSVNAAMALIDRSSDHLKLCRAADWQTPSDHPDLAPTQEALLLKEGFRELIRQLEEFSEDEYDEQFLAWMRESKETAAALELALQRGDIAAARQAFTSVQNQCKRCHSEYRD